MHMGLNPPPHLKEFAEPIPPSGKVVGLACSNCDTIWVGDETGVRLVDGQRHVFCGRKYNPDEAGNWHSINLIGVDGDKIAASNRRGDRWIDLAIITDDSEKLMQSLEDGQCVVLVIRHRPGTV